MSFLSSVSEKCNDTTCNALRHFELLRSNPKSPALSVKSKGSESVYDIGLQATNRIAHKSVRGHHGHNGHNGPHGRIEKRPAANCRGALLFSPTKSR